MKKKLILVIPIILLFIFFSLLIYYWIIPMNTSGVKLSIQKGEYLPVVIKKFNKNDVRLSKVYTKLFYRLFSRQINAGDYYFKSNINLFTLSKILSRGFANGIKVTIPEGFTYNDIIKKLSEKQLIDGDKFKKLYSDKSFIKELGIKSRNLEGYLFPDTYYFDRNNTEQQIIMKMYNNLVDKLEKLNLISKIEKSTFTLNEILTIASLVEWEAKVDSERAIIAQVFLKRLKIYKPLESCATIEYALGEHKEKLSREDLEIKSPYNTYKNFGLPPTPINNPGIKSIRVVLNPADTDYLYFVSKKDGTHEFTKSYKEHLKAKRKYNGQ